MDEVILVNEKDEETGTMEKLEAHLQGKLHRAFSIFLINNKGEWLLQKRANSKYHSAGLWTNACCSHPLPGEDIYPAALRRLNEEMVITCHFKHAFSFIYKTRFDNDLTEHEYDHVFTGVFEGDPVINKDEVSAWRYLSVKKIQYELVADTASFSYWFQIALPRVLTFLYG